MIRKFLIAFLLILVLGGALGIYSAIKYRRQTRINQINRAKAPQTSITFPEGWSLHDMAQYLEKNNITTASEFLYAAGTYDTSAYEDLKTRPAGKNLEGFIFPDTYFIPTHVNGSSTIISGTILKKALDNFNAKITPVMAQKSQVNGFTLYQTITLASIIEKESGREESDRKTIAGIFYNRLKAGIPLQSDATVNFITKSGQSSASIADTQIDSPYNTYKYKDLPPGPICNPSLGSIMAALYPEKTDYLYFLTDPKTGRAVFSKTFEEHIANKYKYLK